MKVEDLFTLKSIEKIKESIDKLAKSLSSSLYVIDQKLHGCEELRKDERVLLCTLIEAILGR